MGPVARLGRGLVVASRRYVVRSTKARMAISKRPSTRPPQVGLVVQAQSSSPELPLPLFELPLPLLELPLPLLE
ncbi:MAG: hypothetical protein QOK43_2876 [Acidimicrobiaceae bacterium]|nr:hypothetical protein [Acidimicrobiaceae bacterium]